MDYRQAIRDEAAKVGIDPNIAEAMMSRESAGNPSAVSSKGAIGLTQLMPATAQELGVDPHDPLQNIQGGVRYLKQQIDKFGVAGGIAAYNAGPGRVEKTANFADLPAETRAYVPAIMNKAAKMGQAGAQEAPQGSQPTLQDHYAALEKAKAAGDGPAIAAISQAIVGTHQQALQKAQAAGDEGAVNAIQGAISQVQPQEAPADFTKLGKTIYKAKEGQDFQGSDQEAADYAKQFASDTRWNTLSMAKAAMQTGEWTPEQKQAYLDLQKDYDKEGNFTGDTLLRVAKSIATDPVTYAGMGFGKLAAKGGQVATEMAVRNALEKSLAKRVLTSTAGKGALEGAVIGGGQNALQQEANVGAGGQDSVDLGETAKVAALGGGIGGALGKFADKVSGVSAVKDLARNAGSEEGAKIDSEIIQKLDEIKQNPNFRDQPVRAEQLNGVANGFIKEADDAVRSLGAKEVAAQGGDAKVIRGALQNWKSLSEGDINALRGSPFGDTAADSIVKAQRTRSLTAEQEATGGISKLIRGGLDLAPIPAPLRFAGRAVLGGQQSRKRVTADLLSRGNLRAAQRISQDLGPSAASGVTNTIQGLASQATARQAAEAATREQTAATAKTAADSLKARQAMFAQMSKDPSYIMGTGRTEEVQKNFSNQMRQQMQGDANAAAQMDPEWRHALGYMSDEDFASHQAAQAKKNAAVPINKTIAKAIGDSEASLDQARAFQQGDGLSFLKNAMAEAKGASRAKKVDKVTQAGALDGTTTSHLEQVQHLADNGQLPDILGGLHTNAPGFQQTLKHVNITHDQLLAHLQGLAKDKSNHKTIAKFLTPGLSTENGLYDIQNSLSNKGFGANAKPALTQGEGALSSVRDSVKYQTGANVRQATYDKVAKAAKALPKESKGVVQKVVNLLRGGTPSDPNVLVKAEKALSTLSPESRAEAEEILAPALSFYRK